MELLKRDPGSGQVSATHRSNRDTQIRCVKGILFINSLRAGINRWTKAMAREGVSPEGFGVCTYKIQQFKIHVSILKMENKVI